MKYLIEIKDSCLLKSETTWQIMESGTSELVSKVIETYNCMSGIAGSGLSVCMEDCPSYNMQKKIVSVKEYSTEWAIKLGLEKL